MVGTLKFLCSYGHGGKILPRSTDGKLRYIGGVTRVFSVDRRTSFAELMVKLTEFCGYSVTLRCQLPNGDLETLISIKSDEELSNLLQEYDRAASSTSKTIRAILTPLASVKQVASTQQPCFKAADRHRFRSRTPPTPTPAVSGKIYRCPRQMQAIINPLRSFYCVPRFVRNLGWDFGFYATTLYLC